MNYPGLEEIHDISSNVMLATVFVHITGVIISSLLHRENLIGAMISGCKPNCERDSIDQTYRWLGLTLAVFVSLFWIWSYKDKIF